MSMLVIITTLILSTWIGMALVLWKTKLVDEEE